MPFRNLGPNSMIEPMLRKNKCSNANNRCVNIGKKSSDHFSLISV